MPRENYSRKRLAVSGGLHEKALSNHAGKALSRDGRARVCAGDGCVMASAQEGKEALIRLWEFATGKCHAILCGHATGMICVDVSQDSRALLGVGLDAHSKQQITLWDITGLSKGKRAHVVLKSTTEFNIKRAKFSEYEADKLMTVGRDSIRLYRVKGGILRGLSIQVCALVVSSGLFIS